MSRGGRRGSQIESVLLLASVASVLIWSFVTLLLPLKEAMQLVKQEYCGGELRLCTSMLIDLKVYQRKFGRKLPSYGQ